MEDQGVEEGIRVMRRMKEKLMQKSYFSKENNINKNIEKRKREKLDREVEG